MSFPICHAGGNKSFIKKQIQLRVDAVEPRSANFVKSNTKVSPNTQVLAKTGYLYGFQTNKGGFLAISTLKF